MAKKKLNFDESMQKLSEIIDSIEHSGAPLDEIIELYKEGTELSVLCAEGLHNAEKQVKMLRKKTEEVFVEEDFN